MARLPLLLATLLLAGALAGCVGDEDVPEPASDDDPSEGLPSEPPTEEELADPDSGWFAHAAEPAVISGQVSGSVTPETAWGPHATPLAIAGAPPAALSLHDITAEVPADMVVRIETNLQYSASQGQLFHWVNGRNEIFWTYDQDSFAGPGAGADTLVARTNEDTIELAVWYGSVEPALSLDYTIDYTITLEPTKHHPSIAYGIGVGRDQTLELVFDSAPAPESIWIWADDDTFIGHLSANDTTFHWAPESASQAGEIVVFVTEFQPRFQGRVLNVDGTPEPNGWDNLRVVTQVIEGQGASEIPAGSAGQISFTVPVVPFQVGYSWNVANAAVDPSFHFVGPEDVQLDQSTASGTQLLGSGGFFSTDMGVPALPPGDYTLMYSDTASTGTTLNAWYVTYAR